MIKRLGIKRERRHSGINTMLTFCPMEFANEGKKCFDLVSVIALYCLIAQINDTAQPFTYSYYLTQYSFNSGLCFSTTSSGPVQDWGLINESTESS